ncbi:aspartate aminotransferase family protein [soil metagenome]
METNTLEQLRQSDREHHLHPFTNHADMHKSGTHVIVGGKGCFITDENGRQLLDGLAGLWCVNVGYGRDEIATAVYEQMKKLPYYCSFFNSTTEPAIELAGRLAKIAPGRLSHTIFSNSGSEANESALKLIRGYWKIRGQARHKILSRTFSYHGVTIATTSMTGLPSCYAPFDLPLPGFIHVLGPYHYGANTTMSPAEYGQWCLAETERVINQEGAGTIAALFAEPIQGAGGVIVPPRGYLKQLRELCRKYEILFVADEVISGFGRLGEWFASGLWDLDPDLMTLAKGLTSGYLPLGATMCTTEISEMLNKGGYLAHGFTYSGHPATTAAGLANLDILEKEKLIPRVKSDIGPYFQKKLAEFNGHPAVGEVRGFELIGAIELLPRGGKAALQNPPILGAKAANIARTHGVIVRGIRDLIAVAPPLVITHAEIDQLMAAIKKTLDQLWD